MVTWNEVPDADKNGIIQSYTVRYQAIGGITVNAPVSFTNVTFPTRMVNLTGLIKNQRYNISVLASTVKGGGPYSPPISASTNEDSKSTFLYDITRYKAYYKAPNKTSLVSFGAGNHYRYFTFVRPKDKRSSGKVTGVIYDIECDSCKKRYLGKTVRALANRLSEHSNNRFLRFVNSSLGTDIYPRQRT